MKKLLFCLAILCLALLPVRAVAALELEVGFDPAEVCPGEFGHFFFALANVGDEAESVTLSVSVVLMGQTYGPFSGMFEMPAGEEAARELTFRVPPPTPAGELIVLVTATDSDGTVEDQASITILDCAQASGGSDRPLINSFLKSLRGIGIQ